MVILTQNIKDIMDSTRKSEGGDSLINIGTDVRAWALGISGVNFWPGIRFWEVNFAWALGFWQFLTKNV